MSVEKKITTTKTYTSLSNRVVSMEKSVSEPPQQFPDDTDSDQAEYDSRGENRSWTKLMLTLKRQNPRTNVLVTHSPMSGLLVSWLVF